MPTHRSLDRRIEYRWNEDGTHTERGPEYTIDAMPLVETYRLALAWIDAYPTIRAAAVKAGLVQPDSDDELPEEEYHRFLQRVGLQEREQEKAAREKLVQELTQAAPKRGV
jgi:hypothetical protein